MKIALVNPRPQRRGGEISSRRLAEGLQRLGHRVLELYLYPRRGENPLPEGETEIVLGVDESHWLERRLGWHPRLARRLQGALDDFAPEIVQVSGGRTLKYGAVLVGRLRPRPLLVYRSIGEPRVWVRGKLRTWLYGTQVFPRVDVVATVADSFVPSLRQLCSGAGFVRSIPPLLESDGDLKTPARAATRSDLATEVDSPTVLFAGGLSREKRVDRLVRAFAATLLALPDATLWIAGDGPLRDDIEALVTSLGIAPHVRLLGPSARIDALMEAADVIALSSDTEGLPAVLREAGAHAKPAVATRVGATAEVIEHGETGLLVDREDEAALSEALGQLLSDSALRRRMGDAAKRRHEAAGGSSEDLARAFEALYGEALDSRGAAA